MKIDPILTSKIIYFSEKALAEENSDFLIMYEYLKLLGLSEEGIRDVVNILKQNNLAEQELEYKEADGYEDLIEYESFRINKNLLKEFCKELKHELRERPFLQRNEVDRVSRQIKTIFNEEDWMKVLVNFYTPAEISTYFIYNKYTLTDLLFSHTYSNKIPLPIVLIEFLNPIYHNFLTDSLSEKLFMFIDNVISLNATKQDYKEWSSVVLSSKFKKKVKNTSKSNTVPTVIQIHNHQHVHQLQKEESLGELTVKDSKIFWVTKSASGEYFFDGNPVFIKSKNANYIVIFDVFFSLAEKGGLVTYKDIIRKCSERKIFVDKTKIQKALSGGTSDFFRYVKGIKRMLPYGTPLINAVPASKSLEFNNRKK